MTVYTTDLDAVSFMISNSQRVAVDLETDTLDPKSGNILLLQVCGDSDPDLVYVVPVGRVERNKLIDLLTLLASRVVLSHNAKFEVSWIYEHYGILLDKIYCSMIAEKVLTAGLQERADLAGVVWRHLGKKLDKDLQTSFVGQNPETFEPTEDQIAYAAEDVLVLHEIRRIQVDELVRKELVDTAYLEFRCIPIFAKMELKGLYLDVEEHAKVIKEQQEILDANSQAAVELLTPYWEIVQKRQQQEAQEKYDEITGKISQLLEPYGNRLSDKVPEDVKLDVQTLRKSRKKPKPDRPLELSKRQMVLDALKEHGINLPDLKAATVHEYLQESPETPVLKSYRGWVKANKLVTTYGENLVEKIHCKTGRISTSFNQCIATGRVASSSPNLQNIPEEVRACVKPESGYKFCVADFSNQEMRICGACSGDPNVIESFKQGKDLHSITAAAAFPNLFKSWEEVDKECKERKLAKICGFAVLYGGTAYTLYVRRVIDDLAIAEAIVKGLERAYPVMMKWLRREGEKAVRLGYARTAMGRKRFFPPLPPKPSEEDEVALKEWNKKRRKQIREASNLGIQGGASDACKMALILISQELREDEYLVNVVHDEILAEAPAHRADEVAEIMARCMLQASKDVGITAVEIPADIYVTDRWEKKKKDADIKITVEEDSLGLVEIVDSREEVILDGVSK